MVIDSEGRQGRSLANQNVCEQLVSEPWNRKCQEELQAKGIQYNVKRESFMRDTFYKDSIMEVLKEHCADDDVIVWSDLNL